MHIDFETYSEAGYHWNPLIQKWKADDPQNPGISGVGAWIYSIHPSANIISLAYGNTVWTPDLPPPYSLFEYIRNGGLCWAYNSFFEYAIWNNVGVPKFGWPPLPLEQLRCSQSRAKAFGLPATLKHVGAALNLDIQKDKAGDLLIRKLCIPRSPTKNNHLQRLTPESNPEDFSNFYKYNLQDIKSEAAVKQAVPALSKTEEDLWLLDQKINWCGVHIDRDGLEACLEILKQAENKYTQELRTITNGAVGSVNEIQNMQRWLFDQDVRTNSLDKEHIKRLLDRELPPHCRRVLELRQILGSASVKKLHSIKRYLAPDDRVRGLFKYCGAERTGRFSAGGPQPHNMPASGPKVKQCCRCGTVQWADLVKCSHCDDIQFNDYEWGVETAKRALQDISTRDLSYVERYWGDPLTTISGCLRSLYSAAPGNELIASDYSAIEAVVLACLAGEEWRIEVFRTHGKIYETSAAKISSTPFEEILAYKEQNGQHHPLRKKLGKVAELASGYGGWLGAWKAFGADKFMDDDEIKQNILRWRDESPMIVEFWGGQYRGLPWRGGVTPEFYGLEGAAVMAVLNPGQCYSYREISYGVKDNVLYCRLPSGRCLAYHQPEARREEDNLGVPVWKLSFMGWNSNPLQGPIGWIRIDTYSGKLTENVVQATARDILTHAMPKLETAGYPIVLHVHDEICSEVPEGYGSVEEYEAIMMERPTWAAEWPIKAAGGWRGKRYRK